MCSADHKQGMWYWECDLDSSVTDLETPIWPMDVSFNL
jgi:hypothetical protein